jgi:hypothetical protein
VIASIYLFIDRWIHGLIIPQLRDGVSVMDFVPNGLAPMIFFALDFGKIDEESPLATVREKLRESPVCSVGSVHRLKT